jgi:hypothetical protein
MAMVNLLMCVRKLQAFPGVVRGCAKKNRSISADASGPSGSV